MRVWNKKLGFSDFYKRFLRLNNKNGHDDDDDDDDHNNNSSGNNSNAIDDGDNSGGGDGASDQCDEKKIWFIWQVRNFTEAVK